MNIKTVLFSVMIVGLLALTMGFVGQSKPGIIVVTPDGASSTQLCSEGGSLIADCPSGTVVVGGGCNFLQGQSAVDEFNPMFLANQSVGCIYTCSQDAMVEVEVYAICARTN